MKFKMNPHPGLKPLLLTGMLLFIDFPALALKSDSEKPVKIYSENQALDIQGNVATSTGNVIITQGTIKLTADKVVVTNPAGDKNKTIVDAWGAPATFYQLQDNGKAVQGHAQKLHYDLTKDLIELSGNAYLEQLSSHTKSERITYLVKEQKMQAWGNNSKRVTTVLVPSQLQDKNVQAGAKNESK